MTLDAAVGPLVVFAAAFQTLVFVALPQRHRTSWAPMTIASVGAALTLAGVLAFGFGAIGLGSVDPAVVGSVAVVTIFATASVGTVMFLVPRLRSKLADPRVASWSNRQAATQIFLRIPVMTALIEEAFFRGLLHAALMAVYPPSVTVGVGAVLFGLWHIGPALDQAESFGTGEATRNLQVALTVMATTVAGAGLVWLRMETGSIWAPLAVHATLNMTMAVFSRIASSGIRTREPGTA